jgi:hypothetical protein
MKKGGKMKKIESSSDVSSELSDDSDPETTKKIISKAGGRSKK